MAPSFSSDSTYQYFSRCAIRARCLDRHLTVLSATATHATGCTLLWPVSTTQATPSFTLWWHIAEAIPAGKLPVGALTAAPLMLTTRPKVKVLVYCRSPDRCRSRRSRTRADAVSVTSVVPRTTQQNANGILLQGTTSLIRHLDWSDCRRGVIVFRSDPYSTMKVEFLVGGNPSR